MESCTSAIRFVFPLGNTPFHVVVGCPWDDPDDQEIGQMREMAVKQFRKVVAEAEANITTEVGTLSGFIAEGAT